MKTQKTITLSGIVDTANFLNKHAGLVLTQEDGYKINLIARFSEMYHSFSSDYNVSVTYYTAPTYTTKDNIIANIINTLHGDIEANYEYEKYTTSSGSYDEYDTNILEVGGHDLEKELSSYINKFVILEITFNPK